MRWILNIVILYNNLEEVENYIKTVYEQDFTDFLYISVVINSYNGYVNEACIRLTSLNQRVRVYIPSDNLGYLNGLTFGYDMIKNELKTNFSWVIYSNTDIGYIKEKNFFKYLSNIAVEDDVWCIAPSVYNSSSKSYDNPEYIERLSKNQMQRLMFIYSYPKFSKIYFKLSHFKRMMFKNKKLDSQFIYSAKGCYFIIRQEFAEYLSLNPYPYLMYSEESYIAELVILNNKRIKYISDLEVIHFESTVTGKLKFETRSKYILETLKYINEKFYK